MNLTFQLNYRAEWGQTLCLIETQNSLLGWTPEHPLCLNCQGSDFWTITVPVTDFAGEITYKYAILHADGHLVYEAGKDRVIHLQAADKRLIIRDFWQVNDYEKAFYSTTFQQALFRRIKPAKQKPAKGNIRFSVNIPQVLPSQGVAVVGNIPELGGWDVNEKLILSDADFPVWRADISVKNADVIEYKYLI